MGVKSLDKQQTSKGDFMAEKKRQKRVWSKEFLKHMQFIIKHENYATMPNKFKKDGEIKWISPNDKKRAEWWDEQIEPLGLKSRADVARAIYPKELYGLHPCQICGKKLSIFYVYPNKNALKKINKETGNSFKTYDKDIFQIFDEISTKIGKDVFDKFKTIFKIPATINETKEDFFQYFKNNCNSMLSPGVMSNAPDRLDGFHTYNACCRLEQDTGRHKSNLARYSQDRRAYENWAEGNWNLSNRLMGEFKKFNKLVACPVCGKKANMTADHIGPISLGFTHRPKFNPMCGSCNSKKNNRMSLSDVKTLIEDEKHKQKVISWHSKYLWDVLKTKIKTDEDAKKLSKIMHWHINNIMLLLFKINYNGHKDFLRKFLHPEYSFFDYKFENFDPLKPDILIINKKPLDNKNKKKNADRYERISFESLEDYEEKDNRKVKKWANEKIQESINELLCLLEKNESGEAYQKLNDIIEELSKEAVKLFNS
jgi:Alw26I/Eco31I/Esp3I family type II restriction endonuclease